MNKAAVENLQAVKQKLKEEFDKAGPEWHGAEDKIWCFGPRRCGPNVLLNNVPGYCRPCVWQAIETKEKTVCKLAELDNSMVTGFQVATLAGPLCEEPMHGVCFVVEDWWYGEKTRPVKQFESKSSANSSCDNETSQKLTISNTAGNPLEYSKDIKDCQKLSVDKNPLPPGLVVPQSIDWTSSVFGPLSGQLISTVKEGCRRAFQAGPQRLVVAMYKCNIQATMDVLGRETKCRIFFCYFWV